MKTITGFIFGLVMAILISATTINTSLITTKPNTPKSVLVKGFGYNEEEEIQQYVSACTKDGYVVKSLNGGGGTGGSWWFLVMEKY